MKKFLKIVLIVLLALVVLGALSRSNKNKIPSEDLKEIDTTIVESGGDGKEENSVPVLEHTEDTGITTVEPIENEEGQEPTPTIEGVGYTVLREKGGRVAWSPDGKSIAFDRRDASGIYTIYLMDADGSNEVCLTCNQPKLKNMHAGNPAWHPSGEHIVFQAQTRKSSISNELTTPGKGVNNELFVMDVSNKKIWQLTDQSRIVYGVLHPHFSHNGKRVVWAELLDINEWALKVGDFTTSNDNPAISGIQVFKPGTNPRFYESHGFSKDDSKILFSSNQESQATYGFDIYLMDLRSEKEERLTNSPYVWDEHAQISPDGKKIIWATKRDNNLKGIKFDLWIMNIDGSGKARVTNFHDSSKPQYLGNNAVGPADSSWGPDGKKVVTYVITDQNEVGGKST